MAERAGQLLLRREDGERDQGEQELQWPHPENRAHRNWRGAGTPLADQVSTKPDSMKKKLTPR